MLLEPLEVINRRLEDRFGRFEDGRPKWRVVWSEDQIESRYGTYDRYSEHGVYLGQETGWREVPKYRQWMPNQYVLENLIPVPENSDIAAKASYEPIWGFADINGNPLPPKWEVIEIVLDQINKNIRENALGFKIPESELQTPEAIEARIKVMEEALFPDASRIGDSLALGEGISLTNTYKES
jgi:hypothetical protein